MGFDFNRIQKGRWLVDHHLDKWVCECVCSLLDFLVESCDRDRTMWSVDGCRNTWRTFGSIAIWDYLSQILGWSALSKWFYRFFGWMLSLQIFRGETSEEGANRLIDTVWIGLQLQDRLEALPSTGSSCCCRSFRRVRLSRNALLPLAYFLWSLRLPPIHFDP